MVVVLNVKVTGSAEIVVTAGSSSDNQFVIADYLGWTLAAVLSKLVARGYRLTFVTDQFFVCTKAKVRKNRTPKNRTNRAAQSTPEIFKQKLSLRR